MDILIKFKKPKKDYKEIVRSGIAFINQFIHAISPNHIITEVSIYKWDNQEDKKTYKIMQPIENVQILKTHELDTQIEDDSEILIDAYLYDLEQHFFFEIIPNSLRNLGFDVLITADEFDDYDKYKLLKESIFKSIEKYNEITEHSNLNYKKIVKIVSYKTAKYEDYEDFSELIYYYASNPKEIFTDLIKYTINKIFAQKKKYSRYIVDANKLSSAITDDDLNFTFSKFEQKNMIAVENGSIHVWEVEPGGMKKFADTIAKEIILPTLNQFFKKEKIGDFIHKRVEKLLKSVENEN